MPVIIAGNEEQKKKYLGRMTEEPLTCVSLDEDYLKNHNEKQTSVCLPVLTLVCASIVLGGLTDSHGPHSHRALKGVDKLNMVHLPWPGLVGQAFASIK